MILVFDLDDTLYDEITFVRSGFRAVATHLLSRYGVSTLNSYELMINILDRHGRGQVFDGTLKALGIYSKRNVMECLKIYRSHSPNIVLFDDAKRILKISQRFTKYIVTDGNKYVQKRKIAALEINHIFKKIITTRQFGIKNEKPSLFCFELIKSYEDCNWNEITYIGDNPKKDFVNLNKVGANTIRIKRGEYSNEVVPHGYDARCIISSLDEVIPLIHKRIKVSAW